MRESAKLNELDINMWMDLAEHDPDKFEAMRSEAIESLIARAPEKCQLHLRRVQWRVDMIRERSTSPMGAVIAISEMMWSSFYELRDRYQELALGGMEPNRMQKTAKSAQIIPFRAPVEA